jgi:hypothetical protein
VGDARMDQFIAKHADKLQGTLSCVDRVLFRGDLPFFSGSAMASFLEAHGVHRRDVKRFVLTQAYRLKDHARPLAAREGGPTNTSASAPGRRTSRASGRSPRGSRRGWSVSSRRSNPAGHSPCDGARGRPSFRRRGGSVLHEADVERPSGKQCRAERGEELQRLKQRSLAHGMGRRYSTSLSG